MANTHKNKKTFGLPDIERYYHGKMVPQEMHELEKASLEDPFLADALEGYAHTRSATEDVVDLKNRLPKRKQQGNTYSMLSRAAAMVLLMTGAGWLLYQVTFKDQDDRISYRNQPEISAPKPVKDTSKKETTLPVEKATVLETKVKEESPGTVSTTIKKPQRSVSKDLQSFKKEDVQVPDTALYSLEAAEDRSNMASTSRGFVTPMVRKAQSDSDQARNSLPIQKRKAPNDKIQISNNGSQVIINIRETPDGIHEIVLSKHKKDSLVKKGPSIIIEEAEPEESWNEFGEYLSNNLSTLEDLQAKSPSGTLMLSFDVNPSGQPVNIQIENSLCKNCDAEAQRLFKEGPKWKKKTKRGKVVIQF
jgi:hypothetical protein